MQNNTFRGWPHHAEEEGEKEQKKAKWKKNENVKQYYEVNW